MFFPFHVGNLSKSFGVVIGEEKRGRIQYTGWTKKECDLKKNGHNSSEIHHKGEKLVCFGKFSINAAR